MVFNIGMRGDSGKLQKDHARLRDLAIKWQMKFIIHKCGLMHKQKSNQREGSLL